MTLPNVDIAYVVRNTCPPSLEVEMWPLSIGVVGLT